MLRKTLDHIPAVAVQVTGDGKMVTLRLGTNSAVSELVSILMCYKPMDS